MNRLKLPALVKGVDYYLEGQRFVFTSTYHRKRGYCCNSKCRHCPYRAEALLSPVLEIVGLPGKPPGEGG